MSSLPCLVQIDENVVQVPVAQAYDVANDGHYGEGAPDLLDPPPPLLTLGKLATC
jgi:hypothetical protein